MKRMKKPLLMLAPLALMAAAPLALAPSAAQAADGGTTYQATLNPLNHATGSGQFTMTVTGDQATVNMSWSGLAKTFNGSAYPHVQHIHVGGMSACPTAADDKNGDGVVSVTEGAPSYGGIATTLGLSGDTSAASGTDLKIAPSGDSLNYQRTFTLNSDTMKGLSTGVVVVHGLDPATLSKKAQGEKSDLVPSLPLAATSPALCGVLTSMPSGGVAAGSGSTGGVEDLGLLAAGGGLMVAGAAAYAARRRVVAKAR